MPYTLTSGLPWEARFAPLRSCWVCGGTGLRPFHRFRLDYDVYTQQDPDLAAYTGETVRLVRCQACEFGQPDRLPTLPRFFDRMYDQRWSADWVEHEFEATYKDLIFRSILRQLDRRIASRPRRLLDVGTHAGRFMHMAQRAGWVTEGVELNPLAAACAARRTGAPVHQLNAAALAADRRRYAATTLIDVLEHIPRPVHLLTAMSLLLEPGGWVAVKVPCGPAQEWKERALAALSPGHAISLANNLVHVNHFSPRSLRLALEAGGFVNVTVATAPPELPNGGSRVKYGLSRALRLAVYGAGRLPGALHTPLALNLLAFAQVADRPCTDSNRGSTRA